MFKLYLLSLYLFGSEQTSLVRPPFRHTMGYNRATPYEVKMILGKSISFEEPQGIAACKLSTDDDKKTEEDDDELTVYCANSWANQIVYNKALKNIKTYGKQGSGVGEFWNPRGITASADGDVYIADAGNNRIVKIKNEIDSLRWIRTIGEFGGGVGQFDQPFDVAVDSYDRIWAADKGNNRVQLFDSSGRFIMEIPGLIQPTGIAVVDEKEPWAFYQNNNFLIVIDNEGKRIQQFNLDGKWLAKAEFQFLKLDSARFHSAAIDYYGNIWVTDKTNICVHKFDRFLKYITKFQLKDAPRGIAIWRRYGQVFIVSREAIDYYWVGIDGYIEGCYPTTFDPKEKGVTISIYLTDMATLTSKIYDSGGKVVRDFINRQREEPFEHNLVWDGRDNAGTLVAPGKYKIEIILEPTYSSKGRFKKKLEDYVTAK